MKGVFSITVIYVNNLNRNAIAQGCDNGSNGT